MDKKKLEKRLKKKWDCPKGCNIKHKVCEHVEELLPAMNQAKVYKDEMNWTKRLTYVDDIDLLDKWKFQTTNMSELENEATDRNAAQFIHNIDKYGLTELEKAILIGRFVNSFTFKRIAEDNNFIGGAAGVHQLYRGILRKIKDQIQNG